MRGHRCSCAGVPLFVVDGTTTLPGAVATAEVTQQSQTLGPLTLVHLGPLTLVHLGPLTLVPPGPLTLVHDELTLAKHDAEMAKIRRQWPPLHTPYLSHFGIMFCKC